MLEILTWYGLVTIVQVFFWTPENFFNAINILHGFVYWLAASIYG